MASFIARQPNGKLCRFSTMVDTVTHINMTEEDYIELCAERGREEARDVLKNHIQPFNMVKDRFLPNNNTVEEFNELLKEMGDNELLNLEDYG